jgi:hypothetical protein
MHGLQPSPLAVLSGTCCCCSPGAPGGPLVGSAAVQLLARPAPPSAAYLQLSWQPSGLHTRSRADLARSSPFQVVCRLLCATRLYLAQLIYSEGQSGGQRLDHSIRALCSTMHSRPTSHDHGLSQQHTQQCLIQPHSKPVQHVCTLRA